MRTNNNDGFIAACGIVVVAAMVAGSAWAGWWLAAHLDSTVATVPAHPPAMVRDLVRGDVGWPAAATPWAIGIAVILLGAVITVMVRHGARRARRSTSVDQLSREMARDRGLRRYLGAGGPPVGRILSGSGPRRELSMTVEDQGLVIAGPRVGKTTSLAIPAALHHQGPLAVTSNKRDIYDAILEPRRRHGTVWLFDPQDLTQSGPAGWWWNPLATTRDVRGARRLASIWTTASREPGATTDAYFDGAAEELLAELLCAAAHTANSRIVAVYEWLNRPDDPTPIEVLRDVAGAEQLAAGLDGHARLPEKQRAGVYGTARQVVAWLADPAIRAWIEPGDGRVEYDPGTLAASGDTLVSLSREGQGSAAPLVTALTAGVLDAAEAVAAARPSGRLDPHLLGVLDEACNVCRWRDLPDLYSHYGSRGIVLVSYAQSWAQLAVAFGEHGAEKLWSSSNVRVYAGGVSDTKFLRRLSELVGEYDETVWSHSTSTGGRGPRSRSESVQQRRRPIMEISTLAALPSGRALVFLSAARAVLVELVPYWDRTPAEPLPPRPAGPPAPDPLPVRLALPPAQVVSS